jgi:hypothetical protein
MRYPLLLASYAAFLVGCVLVGRHEVKMRVVDETGVPVAGAAVEVLFVNGSGSDVKRGTTGRGGEYSASGSGNNSIMLRAEKAGHYPAQIDGLSRDRDHDVKVVLPRILAPVPLYAWSSRSGKSVIIPVQNEWVGFDFEAADWVAPRGKGKTADILFRFRNEFKGWKKQLEGEIDNLIEETRQLAVLRKEQWTMEGFKAFNGKWDGVMEISFPNEGDGIFEEKRYLAYSPMKLPHRAPTDGYVSTWRYEVEDYKYTPLQANFGFFIRSRVKRDPQGKVISANYAKTIGGFNVSPSNGLINFTYYFNPVTNDQNLEFDPKKNLFPKDEPGADVFEP